MKTTLDIPDALYREFKARTATNGEKMRNAVISFIVAYNAGEWRHGVEATARPSARRRSVKPDLPEWAGIAAPFITKYPDNPLDGEKMRDDVITAKRAGII
jgi:hypothetical protein